MYKTISLVLLGVLAYTAGVLKIEYPIVSIILLFIFGIIALACRYTIYKIDD